jgi:hypothetical protein
LFAKERYAAAIEFGGVNVTIMAKAAQKVELVFYGYFGKRGAI